MVPYLAVVSQDIDALVGLAPDVATGLIRADEDAGILLDGLPLDAHELLAGLLAVVILSEAGRGGALRFVAACQARFGGVAPPVIDLAGQADAGAGQADAGAGQADAGAQKQRLQSGMIAALLHGMGAQARRNVALMGDLAQMRTTYARVQDSFARLEDHVSRHALADRTRTFSLEPPAGVTPLVLVPGTVLMQRLPGDSQGLCDVAVLLGEGPPAAAGLLRVTLRTGEDDEIAAEWQIPGGRLQPGWMRLSLQMALPPEARTAWLRLDWSGPGPLLLGQAMRHPDERFQCRQQAVPEDAAEPLGRVLALRGWHYVAGCAAPAPSDGMFPGGRLVRRLVIAGDVLATAVNLRPDNQPYLYLADSASLLLHVNPAGPSVGVLAAGVPGGTTRMSARIMTRAPGGPPVEYAFALAPAAGVPVPGADLPAFDPGHMTDWQRLTAMLEGEIHLDLPAPLEGAHDLYLITRLPEGVADASWGWATFATFRLIL